jgi:four helix bundle protein
MDQNELKARTKEFGLKVIELVEKLPKGETSWVLRRQLLRSATSVGANYRAACRGRSKAEFIAKLGVVIEEADESAYWLEMLVDAGKLRPEQAEKLIDEASQLIAIFTASSKTARTNSKKRQAG